MDNEHKKVLVVEDEEALTMSLKDNLAREGFNVMVAKNGEEGLQIALGEKPDLILLDLLMPKMDGFAMLKKLRENSWGRNVPVIILSNFGENDKVAKAIESGVKDYLVKSNWKIEDVLKLIKEKLPA